jgi:hypothetical protein
VYASVQQSVMCAVLLLQTVQKAEALDAVSRECSKRSMQHLLLCHGVLVRLLDPQPLVCVWC